MSKIKSEIKDGGKLEIDVQCQSLPIVFVCAVNTMLQGACRNFGFFDFDFLKKKTLAYMFITNIRQRERAYLRSINFLVLILSISLCIRSKIKVNC